MKRSTIFFGVVLGMATMSLLLSFPGASECAEDKYPSRPIAIIVNYGPGGSTDVAVRLMAQVAEKKLGVPLIIVNKPGGGGTVGTTELARSKPDGYTIGTLTIAAISVVPALQKVAYDPIKSFDYICGFGRYPYGIYARTHSQFKSIKDVVEAARRDPGKITFGSMSGGIAIAFKYLELKENIKFTFIPLASGQETATMLVGGHTDLGIGTAVYQFIESGEVSVLAWVTEDRNPEMPDVPTMKELGYDIDITGWMSFGVPAGAPKERLKILYDAFKVAHADPKVMATLKKLRLDAPYISGEEAQKIYQNRAIEWKPLIQATEADQKKK